MISGKDKWISFPGIASVAVYADSDREALQAEGLNMPVLVLGLPDEFIEHGDPAKLLAMVGLDAQGIEASVRAKFADAIQTSLQDPLAA